MSPSFLFEEAIRPVRVASPYCHVEQAMAEIDMGIYNRLFPCYIEACAVTQYHKRGAKPGGWGGHATIFMNGAEIDPAAGYPRLRLAATGKDLSGADSGVGVSVNQIFTNVNWVAIPGRLEFFRGGLAPEQTLEDSFYEAAVQRATAAGWFGGIAIRDKLMRQKPDSMPLQEFVVRHSIGTDFAMNFARTAYCARLPLSREALGRAIAYLNAVNESARKNGYTWDAYTNNCSHVAHNALAAARVWDPKEARSAGAMNVAWDVVSVAKALAMGRMSDFSFPANTFVRLYEAGNERPIEDMVAASRNHDVARTMNDGWLSTAPGALIATYPMHDGGRNRLFAPGRDPFLFSVPMLWDKEEKFRKLTRTPPSIAIDLYANLTHFRDRYLDALATQSTSSGDTFYERFRERLAEELQRTESLIAEYRLLAGQPGG